MIRTSLDEPNQNARYNSNDLQTIGVGAVSIEVINAAIKLSNERNKKLLLIASRGQVDSEIFGGGYLNNWTQKDLVNYVLNHGGHNVIVCRDHGGPFQGPSEANVPDSQAIDMSARSLCDDVNAGFKILHVDATMQYSKFSGWDLTLSRTVQLIEAVWEQTNAKSLGVGFEIGMERHNAYCISVQTFERELSELQKALSNKDLPQPLFISPSLGTLVIGTENNGRVANENEQFEIFKTIEKIAQVCQRNDISLKAHNMDYLPADVIKRFRDVGVSSFNVAPEFGVVDTRELLKGLLAIGLEQVAETIVQEAITSERWKKWVLNDTKLSQKEKAELAGHYVTSQRRIVDLISQSVATTEQLQSLQTLRINSIIQSMTRFTDAIW